MSFVLALGFWYVMRMMLQFIDMHLASGICFQSLGQESFSALQARAADTEGYKGSCQSEVTEEGIAGPYQLGVAGCR